MHIGYSVFRAAIECSYKAWLLLKEGVNSDSIIPSENLTVADKIAIAAYYYEEFKPSKRIAQVDKLVKEVNQLATDKVPPSFFQITHCNVCPFKDHCYQQLVQKDCISLLPAMSKTTVEKYQAKGIHTVVQLSHLFKMRRKRRLPNVVGKFLYELKALAIREKKTYVLKSPALAHGEISIYIDFEGLPDKTFIYLIGAVVKQEGKEDESFSFWANDKRKRMKAFRSGRMIK
jgi:predicted RecB family nuclease